MNLLVGTNKAVYGAVKLTEQDIFQTKYMIVCHLQENFSLNFT